MPHDVIMPALGMAQDTGKLVSWLKQPGDAIAEGEPLFEVETDKAVMEVEAQAKGILGSVSAAAGDDVPVGSVVAIIADTQKGAAVKAANNDDRAEATERSDASATDDADTEVPDGKTVIMPALGMAQDSGKLVKWRKEPGDAVSAADILFEVETDKSVMEVEAGHDGFVAACLALEGQEVPVGQPAAIISAEKPDYSVQKSVADSESGTKVPASDKIDNQPVQSARQTKPDVEPEAGTSPANDQQRPRTSQKAALYTGGRILASPKAKWLAHEKGLDLTRLVEAGAPQPYHCSDIETLAAMPVTPAPASGATTLHIQAQIPVSGLTDFVAWMKEDGGIDLERDRIWASFAAGAYRSSIEAVDGPVIVEVDDGNNIPIRQADPDRARLSQSVEHDDAQLRSLIIRDLGETDIISVQLGAPEVPVVSVCENRETITLCLDFTAEQFGENEALSFVQEFAARLKDPLRHLL